MTIDPFRALVVRKDERGVNLAFADLSESDLPEGDVTVAVDYTAVNYKDGLATTADGRVARTYPLVPGIDLTGRVVASRDERFAVGSPVLATGFDLGVAHHGGFSTYARLPGDWLVPLPDGLSLFEAAALGTAGLTAAMCIDVLRAHELPDGASVLVTGASGGVGSLSVAILAQLGYDVHASTGTEAAHDYLRSLGAATIVARSEIETPAAAPLGKQRWRGAVDTVGGSTLATVLTQVAHSGTVAVCGNAGGAKLTTTVFPFILRGVRLIGADSAACPMAKRETLWQRLAREWKPRRLGEIAHEIAFDEAPSALAAILRGELRGRTVVRIGAN